MSSIYDGSRILPDLMKSPLVSPYEESTVDYVGLSFTERKCLDITINRANKPPKVLTINNGNFVIITFRYKNQLYKITGKIQNINNAPNPRAPVQTRVFNPNDSNLCNRNSFILSIDCSDKFESAVYDIHSSDIRDIDLVQTNVEKKPGHKHHHSNHNENSDCSECPYNPNNKPIEDDNPSTDIDITPDVDLEVDEDFGTDPDNKDIINDNTTD